MLSPDVSTIQRTFFPVTVDTPCVHRKTCVRAPRACAAHTLCGTRDGRAPLRGQRGADEASLSAAGAKATGRGPASSRCGARYCGCMQASTQRSENLQMSACVEVLQQLWLRTYMQQLNKLEPILQNILKRRQTHRAFVKGVFSNSARACAPQRCREG